MNYEKTDLRSRFIAWYYNEFQQTELFLNMNPVSENSPWHREDTVAIHTNMVVGQYLAISESNWSTGHDALRGALACAFHDVGKPRACERNGIKWKPERGDYLSFGGHEAISARMWEDYAVTNFHRLFDVFGLTAEDIWAVGWIIEKHLPWGVKKKEKLDNMALTATMLEPTVFMNMLLADTYGRLSDDGPEKRATVRAWIAEFNQRTYAVEHRYITDDMPKLTMLIGASGTGKSTYRNLLNRNVPPETFSLDDLRMEWYVEGKKIASAEDPYAVAYQKACEDKKFKSRANQRFIEMVKGQKDIVVDNINISAKRRRWYLDEAKRRGYATTAVYFPVALQMIIDRQQSRSDKTVPVEAVIQHYNTLQLPQYGEFDEILVVGNNLK